MMWRKLLVFLTTAFASIYFTQAGVASPVTKCKADDAKCIKESSQAFIPTFVAGIQELGVQKLDPVSFKLIDASTPSLNFVLKDITMKGLKDCRAKKVQRDVARSKIFAKFQCDLVNLDGTYEMKGQLLFIPIEGQGPIHVLLRKFLISVEADIEDKVLEDGKVHWAIRDWKHSFDLKDKSDVVFENLFNGNEILGAAAREVVANSGNEIIFEIGPPIVKEILKNVIDNIKAFYKAIPTEDLALD